MMTMRFRSSSVERRSGDEVRSAAARQGTTGDATVCFPALME
jgi:hypothetical protein